MKAQTRLASLRESGINILIGFGIQFVANYFVLPWFGMHPSIADLFGLGAIFTLISVARSYVLRRIFERKRASDVPPAFQYIIEELAAERMRQISGEGYSLSHDDEHTDGEIALGAAAYAIAGARPCQGRAAADPIPGTVAGAWKDMIALCWPWVRSAFKPTTRRRNLIKAGSMIIAEIGRMDRVRDNVHQLNRRSIKP